ncbi:uncharacterized protein LOC134261635 [Saccostrea cucullata]|uniref:uncharacterized protein LOC134261635 n=1 Tax=Saccostrea cuccullata TaxID=36930 RepID=UPI002ED687E9
MIRKNLKAAHVKVHIDNLIPPKDGHSIRAISDKHVQDLVKSFRKSFDPYTVLIGLASTKADISKMSIPNQEPVEILGGNHTVAALKQLAGENSEAYKNVYMDIYTNLTEAQALSLSYKHNELHENSQELSFSEKVVFFLQVF